MSERKRGRPVRLTRIYTRSGDSGKTGLGDDSRVKKSDPLIAAIGAVDELNSVLGLVLVCDLPQRLRTPLERIQNDLFDLGADLSVPPGEDSGYRIRIQGPRIEALERLCEQLNAELEPVSGFVAPGGNEASARLHLARSVCRRAEREVVVAADERAQNPLAAVYLNRLSDLLFICARVASGGKGERLWRPAEPD